MKPYLFLVITWFFWISCKNSSSKQEQSSKVIPTVKLSPADSLIQKFAPIINGDWVITTYIEDLKKTKSAHRSYEDGAAGYDDEIIIDSRDIKGDTVTIIIEDGDGGGGPPQYTVFFKKGKALNTLLVKDMYRYDTSTLCLGYEVIKNDTLLTLFKYNHSGTKLVKKTEYKRVHNELTGDDTITSISNNGLSYFNNKIIISGRYKYRARDGSYGIAEFNDFGKVIRFEGFKTYYILDVFSQGPRPGGDTDDITFNKYLPGEKDYIFKTRGDSLLLYSFEGSTEKDTIYNSHLAYILIRQK